jgi:hypothetical protein
VAEQRTYNCTAERKKKQKGKRKITDYKGYTKLQIYIRKKVVARQREAKAGRLIG